MFDRVRCRLGDGIQESGHGLQDVHRPDSKGYPFRCNDGQPDQPVEVGESTGEIS